MSEYFVMLFADDLGRELAERNRLAHHSGRSMAGGGALGRCSRSAVCADSRRCSSWSVRLHSWKARPWKRGKSYSCYFILLYSSSLTASCHSLDVFSPGISKARWANSGANSPSWVRPAVCTIFFIVSYFQILLQKTSSM